MVTGDAGDGRRKRAAGAGRERRKARPKAAVAGDERRHIIEAYAFFRANHFRAAEPGCYRQQDLKEAAIEIDAVLKRGGRKGRDAKR